MGLLWINTTIAVLGVGAGLFLAMGSVMSIANMQVSWAAYLLLAAFAVPIMFGVSGIGAWVAHWMGWQRLIPWLVGLPWVYVGLFIAAMLWTFSYLGKHSV